MKKQHQKRIATLTRREREVLRVLCQGVGNPAIADELEISRNTVKHHLASIMLKLDVNDRLALILFAWKHQLCPWPKELVQQVRERQRQRSRHKKGAGK